jgi:hypothetical protein
MQRVLSYRRSLLHPEVPISSAESRSPGSGFKAGE